MKQSHTIFNIKRPLHLIVVGAAMVTLMASCSNSYYAASSDDGYYADNRSVDYNTFYNELSPYGTWMDYPSYGRVWVSNQPGFIPYQTGGHWAYTNYGWTWVSDYNWGWAPFHYGRWAQAPGYGWMWVPGYEWAPAWVSWRNGADCYGWAPLSPGMSIGVNVGIGIPANNWVFVPRQHITSPQLNNYYIDRSRNVTIINNTTVINNTNRYRNSTYISGPSRHDVERSSGHRINPMRIEDSRRPGRPTSNGNSINMYRPVVKEGGGRIKPGDAVSPGSNGGRISQPQTPSRQRPQMPNDTRQPIAPLQPGAPQRQRPQGQDSRQPITPSQPQQLPSDPQRQRPQRPDSRQPLTPSSQPQQQPSDPQRQRPQRPDSRQPGMPSQQELPRQRPQQPRPESRPPSMPSESQQRPQRAMPPASQQPSPARQWPQQRQQMPQQQQQRPQRQFLPGSQQPSQQQRPQRQQWSHGSERRRE